MYIRLEQGATTVSLWQRLLYLRHRQIVIHYVSNVCCTIRKMSQTSDGPCKIYNKYPFKKITFYITYPAHLCVPLPLFLSRENAFSLILFISFSGYSGFSLMNVSTVHMASLL